MQKKKKTQQNKTVRAWTRYVNILSLVFLIIQWR